MGLSFAVPADQFGLGGGSAAAEMDDATLAEPGDGPGFDCPNEISPCFQCSIDFFSRHVGVRRTAQRAIDDNRRPATLHGNERVLMTVAWCRLEHSKAMFEAHHTNILQGKNRHSEIGIAPAWAEKFAPSDAR